MKKYVFCGASGRALGMFATPLMTRFTDCAEIVGVYDINKGRSATFAKRVNNIPVFEDFDEMIKTQKPDTVIVTTVDAFHSDYIIRSLELGCDVITEKPMTIDATRCRAILEAEERYGHKVTVTFNYRYAPFMTKIKELINAGEVGEVYSVQFEWLLDRNMDIRAHGTSYFRRWNRRMAKSGGLLVHKSTHHFDLINWWLSDEPEKVSAFGKLNLYGKNSKLFVGTDGHPAKNCRECTKTKECPFYFKVSDFDKEWYVDNEQYDGYYKDGCVFAEDIDIYDTMAVNVSYKKGTMLSYALNATCAYEGWRVSINGSKGRLEAFLPETGPELDPMANTIKVFDLKNNVTAYKITHAKGGHGGGDERLQDMVFRGGIADPLGHAAGTRAGANSILVGAAANLSIKEGQIISITDLLGEAAKLGQ